MKMQDIKVGGTYCYDNYMRYKVKVLAVKVVAPGASRPVSVKIRRSDGARQIVPARQIVCRWDEEQ